MPASTYARALVLGHTMRSGSDASILDELRVLGGKQAQLGGLCAQLWKDGVDPAVTKKAFGKRYSSDQNAQASRRQTRATVAFIYIRIGHSHDS